MQSVFHPGIDLNLDLPKLSCLLFFRWLLALPVLVITQVIGDIRQLETNASLRGPAGINVSFLIYILNLCLFKRHFRLSFAFQQILYFN